MTHIVYLLIGIVCTATAITCTACDISDIRKYHDYLSGCLMLAIALLMTVFAIGDLELFFFNA